MKLEDSFGADVKQAGGQRPHVVTSTHCNLTMQMNINKYKNMDKQEALKLN